MAAMLEGVSSSVERFRSSKQVQQPARLPARSGLWVPGYLSQVRADFPWLWSIGRKFFVKHKMMRLPLTPPPLIVLKRTNVQGADHQWQQQLREVTLVLKKMAECPG